MLLILLTATLHSQNINNTLGNGGAFTIKDASSTFLSLSQSTGYLSLTNSLSLPLTTSSTLGVIFKGTDRFIHDYQASGTNGYNTFIGVNSGNFTMGGAATQASNNTSVGYSSLISLTTGSDNTAIGTNSLYSNTSGRQNSAFGYKALYSNTTGEGNSAFGNEALYSNTTATGNSAFGDYALHSNTTGASNNAFGESSLAANTTGYENSALGYNSLVANTIGYWNSALGHKAMYSNTEGNKNSAIGWEALYFNTVGVRNSAFGSSSLHLATGSYNSALGESAGSDLTTGSNNTFIGYNAQPSSATVSNEITLGDGSITTLRCQVISITSLSDKRDKKNIRDLPFGLEFLMTVKPRLFNWDKREWYEEGKSNGSKIQKNPTAGFIAQELDEAQTQANAEWLNLVLKSNPEKLEATSGNLLPIMVKSIQNLKSENDALRKELTALRTLIAEQVTKEVKTVLLRAIQNEATTQRVSLNKTSD